LWLIEREVTADRVKAYFAPWLPGRVTCWCLPNILALKLVLRGVQAGGRIDPYATDFKKKVPAAGE
jgi:hypothetical protein